MAKEESKADKALKVIISWMALITVFALPVITIAFIWMDDYQTLKKLLLSDAIVFAFTILMAYILYADKEPD